MSNIITNMSWKQFEYACQEIAKQVKQHPKTVNKIFGVPRGGLIPAIRLSHLLGLPLTGKIDESTLLVDDISDSGKTLLALYQKPSIIATLVYNKQSKVTPDIWVYEKADKWVTFWWEAK